MAVVRLRKAKVVKKDLKRIVLFLRLLLLVILKTIHKRKKEEEKDLKKTTI